MISIDMLSFEIKENGWDLSMMKCSYKLTKGTKTEKNEKYLKIFKM